MADLFLSYDHDDAVRAAPIAAALEKAGHSVWWDRHIQGGSQYNDEIEAAVDKAKAVIVLWSKRSIRSTWVRDEASEGRDQGKLIPVVIDRIKPPMGFRQFQTIDLSGRTLSRPALQQLLDTIERLSGSAGPPSAALPASRSIRFASPGRMAVIAGAVAAALAIAAVTAWNWRSGPSQAVVAVTSADNGPASRALADDLLIKLGGLASANSDALQLVEQGAERQADLKFKVGQRTVDGELKATVALLAGEDLGLLWSREFAQGKRSEADLRQQVAYSAGLVLTCAADAVAPGHGKLDQPTLKLYLGGCAGMSDQEIPALVGIFEKVTRQAPDFVGAWAKLLIAETTAFLIDGRKTPSLAQSLKRHIAEARKVDPDMAEALVAESWMQNIRQINSWMPLSEEAVRKNPTNVYALTEHANDMYQVGRLQQGVTYARQAVQADPLSPWVRDSLIAALAHAGEIEAAHTALADAEKLWPGATNLVQARFYVEARYGDARKALQMLRSGSVSRQNLSPSMESFLEARIDPSPQRVDRATQQARAVSKNKRWFQMYIETLGQFGRKEELLKALYDFDPGQALGPAAVFRPRFAFLQNDVRFMAVMKRWGSQFDYWRQSGNWPDFCFRPDLPYDCKAEAARLAQSKG